MLGLPRTQTSIGPRVHSPPTLDSSADFGMEFLERGRRSWSMASSTADPIRM